MRIYFTDDVNINTLEVLGESAANGNLNCIDMLHNFALRYDKIGENAEDILFDLFSGKRTGFMGIDIAIQQASLKLYQTAINVKGKNNASMGRLPAPSRLLYIAGSAICSDLHLKSARPAFTPDFQPTLAENEKLASRPEGNWYLKNTN